jgi:N6-adenosine-specific RNA methylase IME4
MGQRLTSSRLLDFVRVHTQQAGESLFKRLTNRLRKLDGQSSRFGCIHVIPPWPAAHAPKVDISSFVQELLDLPVGPIAAARAHLHLWTPPELLEDGLRVLRAWGFSYRTSLVRLKPCTQLGGYWQQAHEVLLLGVRGELEFPDRSLQSWMDPRTGSGPESLNEVRGLIERASPEPYLELFGGEAVRGWTVLR